MSSVTPVAYDPVRALPALATSGPDRARDVLQLLPAFVTLAERVSKTEFVPKELRGRPEAVLAALMSGAERGLGPMESLRLLHVIEGRPSLSAEGMRALVLSHGHDIELLHEEEAPKDE